jgi:IgA Peptidase M64
VRVTAWLAVIALLVGPSRPALSAESGGYPARYIVFAIDESGAVKPQYQTLVRLAHPRPEPTEAGLTAWLSTATAEDEHVGVRLLDAQGGVAFRGTAIVPRWLRTEAGLHGTGSEAPALVPQPGRAFVVRVPVLEGSRLRLDLAQSEGVVRDGAHDFDMRALIADSSLPLASYEPKARLLSVPPPNSGNRVDLLVMGDGYTTAQSAKFATDAAGVIANFFGLSPYSAYQSFFNTDTVFTASSQSGADHPPYDASCAGNAYPPVCCADPTMQTDPLRNTYVQTAFDATYCTSNIHRLLTVSSAKVLAAAAVRPDWDEILVVVNDTTYGGAGGGFSVLSTNANAVLVAQHEFGHTFSRLADEYTSAYPGYPVCSELGTPTPCDPNVTDQTNRALLKWASWVLPATPVPTPDAAPYLNVVGLFEGANYQTMGQYRPMHTCAMRALGAPFCAICAQEFVLRLYRGGWSGVPTVPGIDNIEPGGESPIPGVVRMSSPGSKTFSVTLLQPSPATVGVRWQVDGVPVGGATSTSFTFTPPGPGRYEVKVIAQDATSLVQSAMAGTSLTHSRTWTVNVGAAKFYSVAPCRIVDTRGADAPALVGGQTRAFTVATKCLVPLTAWAVSMNLTVTAPTSAGDLRVFPAGSSLPSSSALNYGAGQTRANNAVLSLNGAGKLAVLCEQQSGQAHFILDVNGYFE